MGARFHPFHRSVTLVVEPAQQVGSGIGRAVGASEAAGDEAEPLSLRAYCFLQLFASIHGRSNSLSGQSL